MEKEDDAAAGCCIIGGLYFVHADRSIVRRRWTRICIEANWIIYYCWILCIVWEIAAGNYLAQERTFKLGIWIFSCHILIVGHKKLIFCCTEQRMMRMDSNRQLILILLRSNDVRQSQQDRRSSNNNSITILILGLLLLQLLSLDFC